jgi:sulfate/thiosulfate transport system permease protein
VVAGNISGKTQTLPLFVRTQFDQINLAGAYAAAIVLAILAMTVLFTMSYLQKRSAKDADEGGELPLSGPGVFVPQTIEKEA